MIVVANHNGQTGNRIVLFLHSLATALETKQSLVFLFGSDIRKTCRILNRNSGIRVWCLDFSAFRLWRFGLFVVRKLSGRQPFSSQSRRRFLQSLPVRLAQIANKPRRLHFVSFWDFKNNAALVAHRDEILDMVAIDPRHFLKPDKFLVEAKRRATTLVGVHIRRGDYRSFHGGKFMFDLADWARFMNSFLDEEPDQAVCFVISSDESISVAELRSSGFKGCAMQMADGNPCEDMALLSRCDFIMGVPSTFSWCAAFLGNRPLLVLRDRSATCKRSCFRLVCGDEYRIQSWGQDSFMAETSGEAAPSGLSGKN